MKRGKAKQQERRTNRKKNPNKTAEHKENEGKLQRSNILNSLHPLCQFPEFRDSFRSCSERILDFLSPLFQAEICRRSIRQLRFFSFSVYFSTLRSSSLSSLSSLLASSSSASSSSNCKRALRSSFSSYVFSTSKSIERIVETKRGKRENANFPLRLASLFLSSFRVLRHCRSYFLSLFLSPHSRSSSSTASSSSSSWL